MKDVILKIRSVQDGTETSCVSTVAKMKKNRNSGYSFEFSSPDEELFDSVSLKLSLNKNGLVLSSASGRSFSDLVLEKGKKHYCHYYNMNNEDCVIGIDTKNVKALINDDGGVFEVEYYMDYNLSNSSRNMMQVSVNLKKTGVTV